jgi:hypothetical protein
MTLKKHTRKVLKNGDVSITFAPNNGVETFDANAHLLATHKAIVLPIHRIGIVIPSTQNYVNDGYQNIGYVPVKYALPASQETLKSITDNVYVFFSQFGGFTSNEQFGGWMDTDNAKLILERGLSVWAYGIPTRFQVDSLVQIAQSIKATLNQDNVLIIVNDIPYLI